MKNGKKTIREKWEGARILYGEQSQPQKPLASLAIHKIIVVQSQLLLVSITLI
jgi:hypothetical protein